MPVTRLSYASKYFTILCLPYLLILMVSTYHSIDHKFVMSHVVISCARNPSGVILAATQPSKYYHPNVSLSFIHQKLTPPKFCAIQYHVNSLGHEGWDMASVTPISAPFLPISCLCARVTEPFLVTDCFNLGYFGNYWRWQ